MVLRVHTVHSACCSHVVCGGVPQFPYPLIPQQSEIYQGIDPAEFVNYLYKLKDSIGIERIEKFQQVCVRTHVWARVLPRVLAIASVWVASLPSSRVSCCLDC